jgi:hypothetical protein
MLSRRFARYSRSYAFGKVGGREAENECGPGCEHNSGWIASCARTGLNETHRSPGGGNNEATDDADDRRRIIGAGTASGKRLGAVGVNPTVSDADGNTAGGTAALYNCLNTNNCLHNTAFGSHALDDDTTGNDNTANGVSALLNNNGSANTASGADALFNNTTGNANTASGADALNQNTTGGDNTASGFEALLFNNGSANTANGVEALNQNTTGGDNTASGVNALIQNTTGDNNIGLGYNAGGNIIAGSNNIDIGGTGSSDESNTIRIGVPGTQNKTFIAGINRTRVFGPVVEVSSNGQLGVLLSSARYKRDIRDLGDASAGLMKLRPVSFRYKDDSSGTLEYGLVAEEVARVYPNLVTYGPDGKLQSVRYLEFTALLLNELQKQARELHEQTKELQKQAGQNHQLSQENRELRSEVAQVRAAQAREYAAQARERTVFDQRLAALERAMWASKSDATLSAVALRTEAPAKARQP